MDDTGSFDTDRSYDRDLDREGPRHHRPARLNPSGSVRAHFSCPAGTHEAMKADPAQWSALKSIGMMPAYAYDDMGRPLVLALRNCGRCHSTLALEVPATTEAALAILRKEGLL